MWTPQDLAKYANSGTVKPLAVIVAHVLEAKLMGSIQEAVDCMKLLGTYQQVGTAVNLNCMRHSIADCVHVVRVWQCLLHRLWH
jgi:hypothetical protein